MTKTATGNNKSSEAKRLLVRYIRDNGLSIGARLPSQDFLRRLFHLGTSTIGEAIHALHEEKVLEVRDKIGIFVRDPNVDGHSAYTVGIVSRVYDKNLYYASMLAAIQAELTKMGCIAHFFVPEPSKKTTEKDFFSINDFPGLRRCIESGSIQGILQLDDFTESAQRFCRRKKIPTMFLGSLGSTAQNAILFDQKTTLCHIAEQLLPERPKRSALIVYSTLQKTLSSEFRRLFGKDMPIYAGREVDDGTRIGEEIAALPASRRPDWLIFQDDLLALAALSRIAILLPQAEQPPSVIMTSLHFNLRYPVQKAFFYECDLRKNVALAISHLLRLMREKQLDAGRFLLPFTL